MRCSDARVTAFYYLDRQLDDNQRHKLEVHIKKCKICRERLELMQVIPDNIKANQKLTPGPNFTAVIMQRVNRIKE
ncbi:MAG TPA: zf-HC2 domain-containing protein [Chloroflexia bacterium]|nr:zf-HC2 domain-containing protein [Chloroflexia bacterium]